MKRSNYRPKSVSNATRKITGISTYNGIDYTNPIFSIDYSRAIDSLNYIYRDGFVQSRNGIEKIFKIDPYTYIDIDTDEIRENSTNVNNIWAFIAEDDQQHIIAHIGKLLFEVINIENKDKIKLKPLSIALRNNGYKVCYEFENIKSQAFVGGKKLWFLGGNKYMVIRFIDSNNPTIQPVEDSDLVPIPTTTVSITYKDSKENGRQNFDKVNLLTQWRKNMLLSGVGKIDNPSTFHFEYALDAPLIFKEEKDMSKFEMIIEERGVYNG